LDFDRVRLHQRFIVDGLPGTGISDPVRGVTKDAIEAINAAASNATRIVSIDMPSGLNHVSGQAPRVAVKATHTLNLHMLKSGQVRAEAREYIGELWSAESHLGFTTFPEELPEKFRLFYRDSPIRKV
jgi:NAD(P)H-hydrate epimerase